MIEADNTAVPKTERPSSDIKLFIIKTCIVAVVISACTVFVADWIIMSAEESAARSMATIRDQFVADLREQVAKISAVPIGGRQFWEKLEDELDRTAGPERDLPPEKKEKLVKDVRIIVARWRPFIDAVQDEMQRPTSAQTPRAEAIDSR